MNTKKRIVVIGSSNTDMVIKSDHLPAPGETVLGGAFKMNPGGKGANQAVAAARLGGEVTFISRVGSDLFGEQAIKGFEQYGIDTRYITKDQQTASGIALILVDGHGENSISVALGANATMSPPNIEQALPLIQDAAFVLMQLETPLSLVEYVGGLVHQHDIKLILNPAPAAALSDDLLSTLYMITPNTIEAGHLSGVEVNSESTAKEAAERLRAKGVQIVIITMGAKGAYVLSDELNELIPCPTVKVVDTTAAGDTFNGALTVALAEGQSLRDAIVFANQAAAYSVGILGAQTSAPTLADLVSIKS